MSKFRPTIIPLLWGACLILITVGGPGAYIGWPLAFSLLTLWSTSHNARILSEFSARQSWRIDMLIVSILSGAMVYTMLLGHRPISHDHTVHLSRILMLQRNLLESGQLHGWLHNWFAGYPLGYFYPLAADLYILAIKAFTFGRLTIEHAYGFGFGLFFILRNLTVYYVGRKLVSRSVGILAAVIMMVDMGQPRYGGWLYTIWGGVWHHDFSLIFFLLSIPLLLDCLSDAPAKRSAVLLTCVTGLALISHPIQLIFMPATVVMICIMQAVVSEKGLKFAGMKSAAVSILHGCLLASFWVVPFVFLRHYAQRNGLSLADHHSAPHSMLTDLGRELVTGKVYGTRMAVLSILGFYGAIVALLSRRPSHIIVGGTVFLGLLLSTDFLRSQLGLPLGFIFDHVIFKRLAMQVKPFWYMAAAIPTVYIISSLLLPRITEIGNRRSSLHSLLGLWILFGVLFPFAKTGLESYLSEVVRRKEAMDPLRTSITEDQRIQVANWLTSLEGVDPLTARIGLEDDSHSLVDILTQSGLPFTKLNYTPATEFKYKTFGKTMGFLNAHRIKYVISSGKNEHFPFLELQKQSGRIKLYRNPTWLPSPVISLTGEQSVVEFSADRERVDFVLGPESTGDFLLPIAYFPNWSATRDGLPVEVQLSAPPGDKFAQFLKFRAAPGRYHLSYQRGVIEWAGYLLTITAVLLLIYRIGWLRYKTMAVEQRVQVNFPPAAGKDADRAA